MSGASPSRRSITASGAGVTRRVLAVDLMRATHNSVSDRGWRVLLFRKPRAAVTMAALSAVASWSRYCWKVERI